MGRFTEEQIIKIFQGRPEGVSVKDSFAGGPACDGIQLRPQYIDKQID